MDKSLLIEFQEELKQIRKYIEHLKKVNQLVGVDLPNEPVFNDFKTHFKVKGFQKDKKTFEYKAIVISLYGLVEKYVDLWVQEYLNKIATLISYENLSARMKDEHFRLSMKLINIIIEGRQEKYNHLKKETALNKLNNCIKQPQSYSFNTEAFTLQSGNLKHGRIVEIFNSLNIPLNVELISNEQLNLEIGVPHPENTEANVLYGKLNEIVDRRNTIAHGDEIDDLLSLPAFEPYISFLEKYCEAIFSVLEDKYIEAHLVEQYQQQVENRGVFPNHSAIGFSIENYEIKVGDWVIIKTPANRFYKKEIKSLQKDRRGYNSLKITKPTDISVGINNDEKLPITTQCEFYLKTP